MKYGLSEETYDKIKKVISNNTKYHFLLFGSRARGNYKKTSDIDIAIVGNLTSAEKYKIMNEIDLVFIDEITNSKLLESINRDGVEF